MTFTRHAGLKWLLLGGLLLALALLLLTSRAAAADRGREAARGGEPAECGGMIEFGGQTSDWIEQSGGQCVYRFAGEAGQEITIAMVGVTLDNPNIVLQDAEGPLGAKECAKPVDRNVRIQPTVAPTPLPLRAQTGTPTARLTCYLPRSGTYTIVASRDPGARTRSATGQFVLNLCGTHIANPYDETLKLPREGEIARKGLACYSFEAEAGDCVTTAMNKVISRSEKNSLDPWLDLRDPSGTIVASDDNSNGDDDALIRNFCLKKPGLYTIIARSYDFSGAGAFNFYFALEEGARQLKK